MSANAADLVQGINPADLQYFITRNGRRVPAGATDQAASATLIRTVRFYTDGTAITRPQLCVSPTLTNGNVERARALAERLDRRGYLPPDEPMTRDELHQLVRTHSLSEAMSNVVWLTCGLGVPLGVAIEQVGVQNHRSFRRRATRVIKSIGWSNLPAGDE